MLLQPAYGGVTMTTGSSKNCATTLSRMNFFVYVEHAVYLVECLQLLLRAVQCSGHGCGQDQIQCLVLGQWLYTQAYLTLRYVVIIALPCCHHQTVNRGFVSRVVSKQKLFAHKFHICSGIGVRCSHSPKGHLGLSPFTLGAMRRRIVYTIRRRIVTVHTDYTNTSKRIYARDHLCGYQTKVLNLRPVT